MLFAKSVLEQMPALKGRIYGLPVPQLAHVDAASMAARDRIGSVGQRLS